MEEADSSYLISVLLFTLGNGKQYFFFNFNFLTPKIFCIGVQSINHVDLLKQSSKFQVNNSNF